MAGWKRGAISADFKKAAAGFCLVVILAIFVPRSQIEWPQSLVGRVAATPAMLALELPHDVDEFERFVRTTQQRGLIKAAILNDQLAVLGWMVFFAVASVGSW